MAWRRWILTGLMLAGSARAGELSDLPATPGDVVAQVEDGMSLVLRDGRTVRLAGIDAPESPLGRPSGESWPLAAAAQRALAGLAQGRAVTLRGTVELDRYGRQVAQLEREDGLWLEAALVEQGCARVMTTLEHRERAAELLAREAAARAAGLGLWRSRAFAVRAPDALEHADGSFVLVEGTVGAVDERHGALWLDFGPGALAARLDRAGRRRFAEAGLDPAELAGRRIRLRGWVQWQGRPVIELTLPEQVERVEGPG